MPWPPPGIIRAGLRVSSMHDDRSVGGLWIDRRSWNLWHWDPCGRRPEERCCQDRAERGALLGGKLPQDRQPIDRRPLLRQLDYLARLSPPPIAKPTGGNNALIEARAVWGPTGIGSPRSTAR
jgi:hypothetical protein